MSDIKLHTDTLRDYGRQLLAIEGRIGGINLKMKTLYTSIPLTDLGKLIRADYFANFSLSLIACANYCYGTADEFDELENKLCNQNPLDFNKPPVAGIAEFLYDASVAVGSAVQTSIDAIKSAGEAVNKIIDDAADWIRKNATNILTIVAALATIVVAIGLIATGGGAFVAIGLLMALYAANDIWGACAQIATQDENQHGFLENMFRAGLGDEVGSRLFAVSSLGVTALSLAAAPTALVGKTGKIAGAATKVTRIKDLGVKQACNAFKSTKAFINSEKVVKIANSKGFKTAKGVYDGYQKYSGVKDYVTKGDTIIHGDSSPVNKFINTVEKNVIKAGIQSAVLVPII